MEGVALNAHRGNQFKINYANQHNSITGNRSYPQSNNSQHRGSFLGFRLFVDYCKKLRHTKDKCYRLHGFPQDFKFTKGKNAASAATAHDESFIGHHENTSNQGGANNTLQYLTKELHSKLMHLLESFHGEPACKASNNIISGAANFTGPFNEKASEDWYSKK